ncbi:NAD(P)-binding protein [Zopfia rhizophila CBS 207.26]|uniref:NAD(P)-binding protein n=1 Tax=Zopfia rhizophila CBS 207.26 TaxID=1314779 RepID=A0A6A6DIH7_9PEZI|nr:NAD(P)-binding protein [Zopfia rhizophila CBS 207.26]
MFEGKYYTVTGAASGIGRATAIRLAELGVAGIAISDVDIKGLRETEVNGSSGKRIGSAIITHTTVDVRNREGIQKWIEDSFHVFGKLDGAANVAGVAGGNGDTTIETIVQEDWDLTLGVNLTGALNCMRAQLSKIAMPGGSIVNVSSTSGQRGLPHSAAYASSKFSVIGLTESAAGEYGREGIRINALLPGPISTKIFTDGEAKGLFDADKLSKDTLLQRMGQADEVAKVLCFLLSDDTSYVTGVVPLPKKLPRVSGPQLDSPELWTELLVHLCSVSATEPYGSSYYWGQDIDGEPDTLWGLEGYGHAVGFFLGHPASDMFKMQMAFVDAEKLLRQDYDLHHYDAIGGFLTREDDPDRDSKTSFVVVHHFWAVDNAMREALLGHLKGLARKARELPVGEGVQSCQVLRECSDMTLATLWVRTRTEAHFVKYRESETYQLIVGTELKSGGNVVAKSELHSSRAFNGHIDKTPIVEQIDY